MPSVQPCSFSSTLCWLFWVFCFWTYADQHCAIHTLYQSGLLLEQPPPVLHPLARSGHVYRQAPACPHPPGMVGCLSGPAPAHTLASFFVFCFCHRNPACFWDHHSLLALEGVPVLYSVPPVSSLSHPRNSSCSFAPSTSRLPA